MTETPRPTRAPWSIRRRLVVGVVALLAVVGVLIGAISVVALRQNLRRCPIAPESRPCTTSLPQPISRSHE